MWPGQQPPGGEQNPQQQQHNPYQQPGYQQPNPYQQPGYQQPNPYAQQPQWGAAGPVGTPEPPRGGGGNKTKVVAIAAATAVVVAAGVTGFLVLGGDKDDEADGGKGGKGSETSQSPTTSADPSESASGSDDNPRGNETEKATIAGWKVVINPKYGTAFDVPADWEVSDPGVFTFFEDQQADDGSAYIGFSAPAFLKHEWCTSDDDKDGVKETSSLASTGTKGENGGKDTASIARGDAASFAFGGYTNQTDAEKKYLKIGEGKSYTTASGVKGSVATSYTSGVPKKDKCDTDGKATTFAFKNSAGDFVSWTLYGAKGVGEELSDATIQKILSTVRLHGDPTV